MKKLLFLMCLSSCVLLTSCKPDPNQATMPDEFLDGRLDELKNGDVGYISAYSVRVDLDRKIWIDRSTTVYNSESYETKRSVRAFLKVDKVDDVYVLTLLRKDLDTPLHKNDYKWTPTKTFSRVKVAKFSVE